MEVIVPNSDLISERLTNWTLTDLRHRVQVKVGVAYGTDPEEVLDILMKVAQAHPDVLHTPSSRALFRGFEDSSLRVWNQNTLRGWQATLQSDLSVAINKALAEKGIEIPFPQRDLHVRGVVPELQELLAETARQQRWKRSSIGPERPRFGLRDSRKGLSSDFEIQTRRMIFTVCPALTGGCLGT